MRIMIEVKDSVDEVAIVNKLEELGAKSIPNFNSVQMKITNSFILTMEIGCENIIDKIKELPEVVQVCGDPTINLFVTTWD
jgi:hypothetical protein